MTAIDLGAHRRTIATVAAFVVLTAMLGWTYVHAQQSSASFSDIEEIPDNSLGAGTVVVVVGERSSIFEVDNMAPGDRALGVLEIVNDGTLPFRFLASATVTEGRLADELDVIAWRSTTSCGDSPPAGAATWAPLTDPPATVVAGPVGARRGRLGPGSSMLICLAAELPLSTSNDVQAQRLEFGVTIDAEHDVAASETSP